MRRALFGLVLGFGLATALSVFAQSTFLFGGATSRGKTAITCATATDDFDIDVAADGTYLFLDLEDCDQDAIDLNAPTNAVTGTMLYIEFEQSTAGTEDITFNAVYEFPGGVPSPFPTQTNNAKDAMACMYNGAVFLCTVGQDFQNP